MEKNLVIEDIEDMRNQAGIRDVELWQAIRRLRAGDCVKLTLRGDADAPAGETLRVRITRVRGVDYCGTLVEKPTSRGLSWLDVGSAVVFRPTQIHSLADRQVAHRERLSRAGHHGRRTSPAKQSDAAAHRT